MNPGDLIEWFYNDNDKAVNKDEELWSSSMQRWVPIGGTAFLISTAWKKYTWLSKEGLFSAEAINHVTRTKVRKLIWGSSASPRMMKENK